MSVAQVKKRFEEFESFLKRDKEGLRRLKLLKDDVNVLRTSLAAAIEAKASAEVIKDAARERADKAQQDVELLKQEVERLKSQVGQLQHENSKLSGQVEHFIDERHVPFHDEDFMESLSSDRIYRWAHKTLLQCGSLKQMSRCLVRPKYGFSIHDVLYSFDEPGFATLGRIVFLTLLSSEAVTIFWPENEEYSNKDLLDMILKRQSDKTAAEMVRLFLRNVDTRSDKEVLEGRTGGGARFRLHDSQDTVSSVLG